MRHVLLQDLARALVEYPVNQGRTAIALGNILIIQEPDVDCPDDNVGGGDIVFDFVQQVELVKEMVFLDIDSRTSVVVYHDVGGDMLANTMFNLPQLGDNSKQTLEINIENVMRVTVKFESSGAVASISFCSNPVVPPTIAPAPTPSGGNGPTPATPTGGPPVSSPTNGPPSDIAAYSYTRRLYAVKF